ncbi:hypothetical protein EDB81DRAFT_649202 [Dactylonectria macrodidyma]|uniref:Clr5 domain-containing protein n=1 Tax=Dactylonectria macrodidyma TaxID=307937 RepID=A0A9P9F600_9HYPO|nr:hypothetical protein EDB81DRAFT_649202 [Dactylonectria macrodidyma]
MAGARVFLARRNSTPPGDSDDTDISMPRSIPRKRIPSQEWEKKRPIITRLYQEEKKSLKEVMDILERDHNFTATVKMYKSRIWKWGLDKKLKGDEVLAILILKTERDAQGKPSEFTIRGQPVDLDNINRYIRRNPSLVARFQAGEVPSIQTTLEVQCHTPSPAPSPSSTAPIEVSPIEEVLGLFRNYVDSCFMNGVWEYEYNTSCTSCRPGDRSDELFERVMTGFALVNRSMMRKDEISISTILGPAFESLKEIIASESPIFVARTACLLWYLDRNHKNDLHRIVMDYLAGLVPIVLGQDNPMVRIWQILGSPQFTEYSELAMRIYSTLIPLMEERIGPANYITAILYGDHIDYLLGHDRSTEALAVATSYRAKADATGLQHQWLIELAIGQTAVLCKTKEREGKFQEAIDCLQALKDYSMGEEQLTVINIQLGNYSFRMGDFHSAVHWFQEATRLAITGDIDERLLQTSLANLERGFSRTGRMAEATQAQQYRLGRLTDFVRDSSTFASLPCSWREPCHSETSIAATSPVDDSRRSSVEVPDWLWTDTDEARLPNATLVMGMT